MNCSGSQNPLKNHYFSFFLFSETISSFQFFSFFFSIRHGWVASKANLWVIVRSRAMRNGSVDFPRNRCDGFFRRNKCDGFFFRLCWFYRSRKEVAVVPSNTGLSLDLDVCLIYCSFWQEKSCCGSQNTGLFLDIAWFLLMFSWFSLSISFLLQVVVGISSFWYNNSGVFS